MNIEFLAEFVVREWIKSYKRAPIPTMAATIVAALVIGVAIYFIEQQAKATRETRLQQNLNYSRQAEVLDETRKNLLTLVEFVEDERKRLQVSQQSLDSLKAEHDRLRPLVEIDRKAIDALFTAQEARNQAALTTERWIGFGFGVISSLVASFLWAMGSYVLRKRKEETTA